MRCVIQRVTRASVTVEGELVSEITTFLAYEALRDVRTVEVTVQTPLAKTVGRKVAEHVVLVPILRAGMGMLDAMLRVMPYAKVGVLGLQRNEETAEPVPYYAKVPPAKGDELAIVIDTSGSCLETLTARFLDETRALLADGTLFARRFNLRLLQCDAAVRRDDAITCLRDFERYIENLRLVGGGGTDFRPAFRRIDRLVERGAFRRLGVALFFSDGMGLFPDMAPDYDVIFVFFRGRYDDIDVPPWAHKLVLEGELHEHS